MRFLAKKLQYANFFKVFKFKDFFKIKRGHQGGGWALGYIHANSKKNKGNIGKVGA